MPAHIMMTNQPQAFMQPPSQSNIRQQWPSQHIQTVTLPSQYSQHQPQMYMTTNMPLNASMQFSGGSIYPTVDQRHQSVVQQQAQSLQNYMPLNGAMQFTNGLIHSTTDQRHQPVVTHHQTSAQSIPNYIIPMILPKTN